MNRSRQEKTVAIFWRTVRPLDMDNQNSESSDKICPGNDPVALGKLKRAESAILDRAIPINGSADIKRDPV
jgi:hypothetical protein